MSANTVHNARVQLAATAFNNLALAVVVAGFVAPATNGQLQTAGRVLVGLVWIGFGLVLHLMAQWTLGRLQE
jgi:hypothetical protein